MFHKAVTAQLELEFGPSEILTRVRRVEMEIQIQTFWEVIEFWPCALYDRT